MADKEFYMGSVGPLFYDDAQQSKAVVDDGDTYMTQTDYNNLNLNVSKQTITVVTGVDFQNETTTTEEITFVTDVSLNK